MNQTQQTIAQAHQAGTCLQAELSRDLDQLARQMRQALGDVREAGYSSARAYYRPQSTQAQETSTHADQLATVAERTMWDLFYKLAGEVKSNRRSCHCAERMGQAG